MCVIVVKPKDVEFSVEDFKRCWNRNGHGLGYYAFIDGKHLSGKGLMNEKKALKKTEKIRKKGVTAVFHFRIQSKGGVSSDLTHPFKFSNEEEERLLFHNGTIHEIRTNGKESDSSILAEKLLQPLQTESVYKILQYLTPSRFVTVIISKKEPDKKPEIKMFGSNESAQHRGLWYSNLLHLNYKGTTPLLVGD